MLSSRELETIYMKRSANPKIMFAQITVIENDMLLFTYVLTTKYLKDYSIAGKVQAKVSLHSSEKELF